ncbi:ChaN family lipoprotein [Profundibacterium mesophilum]|uniref:Haem-binding uptake Tiki superfamily ChaN domain-containing protein n=1 Tax=Profundibacterium mesophilum KAUST100406-0324 TaxID=1037889 RepID=A0A921TBC5_9RHOB|nr:ChaN family lipoprotein [Profundibacterium mesophilum]KAF0675345.1 hypothetical protein PMES_02235 [Profundibacterium mesophilum KAUST100406-0324]
MAALFAGAVAAGPALAQKAPGIERPGAAPARGGPTAEDFAAHDVAIFGEIHDNPDHHANQAVWVALQRPRALVFEMLTPALGREAMRLRDAPRAVLQEALQWEARGWPDFDLYVPIFEAAPQASIHGADPGRDAVRMAAAEGAAAAFGEGAFRFGLELALPEEEATARIAAQAEAHCGLLPSAMLPGMVEAQRLRDAALARAVIAAMEETGGPVAVITGTGHARRDYGIPAALARAAPGYEVLSIGQGEGSDHDGLAPFDIVAHAPAPERGDPCDALR